jgi:hypothetical protein
VQEAEVKSAKEEAAAEVDAAAVQSMQEHEARLTRMLEEAQGSLASMQRLYRVANDKLFELQSQNEESAAGSASELDLASLELERAQQRCACSSTDDPTVCLGLRPSAWRVSALPSMSNCWPCIWLGGRGHVLSGLLTCVQ